LVRSHTSARDPSALQAAPPEEAAQGIATFPANAFPVGVKHSAAELRKRFPFVSLSKRLEPETRRRARAADRPDPKLAEASRKRLQELEKQDDKTSRVRSESLRLLHSNQLDKFISREGFGM